LKRNKEKVMEKWSDHPTENYKIKIFLDTNILACLIDETHSGLTESIKLLSQSEFIKLVSSVYVAFEFVGIRKREHFLRKVIENSKNTKKGHSNYSTLFKFKDSFKSDDVDFFSINEAIKQDIETEINKITSMFNIEYSDNNFHEALYKPTIDICLASRISREDSLMLISALLPEPNKPEKQIFILSKDQDFIDAFNEFQSERVLSQNSLFRPTLLNLRNISSVNLISQIPKNLNEFWGKMVISQLIINNQQTYLGIAFSPANPRFPKDVFCFELISDKQLTSNIYITVIGKDLDFIYTTKHRVTEFWNNKPIKNYPFVCSANASNISFKIYEVDSSGKNVALSMQKMNKLREKGNLVFVHPDT
jgi:hypothetical protein